MSLLSCIFLNCSIKLPSLENVFFNSADVGVAVAVDLIGKEVYHCKKNMINTKEKLLSNQ